jgi:nucleoside phosphorylase
MGQNEIRNQIKIGIITALPEEFAAMRALLDNVYEDTIDSSRLVAGNRYSIGEIPAKNGGKHVVALALLPEMGNNFAASIATKMQMHYGSIELLFVTGIAGGVPSEVRLGDVVISTNGVFQYDYGKQESDQFIEKGNGGECSAYLLQAVGLFKAQIFGEGAILWRDFISRVYGNLEYDFSRPNASVEFCYMKKRTRYSRIERSVSVQPEAHYGKIASGNVVQKDPHKRDALHADHSVIAIEMEGSGVKDAVRIQGNGYLAIRGICDYCDKSKNDEWHCYAAAVAAAYTRALIESMPQSSSDVAQGEEPKLADNDPVKMKLAAVKIEIKRRLDETWQLESSGHQQEAFQLINDTITYIEDNSDVKGGYLQMALRQKAVMLNRIDEFDAAWETICLAVDPSALKDFPDIFRSVLKQKAIIGTRGARWHERLDEAKAALSAAVQLNTNEKDCELNFIEGLIAHTEYDTEHAIRALETAAAQAETYLLTETDNKSFFANVAIRSLRFLALQYKPSKAILVLERAKSHMSDSKDVLLNCNIHLTKAKLHLSIEQWEKGMAELDLAEEKLQERGGSVEEMFAEILEYKSRCVFLQDKRGEAIEILELALQKTSKSRKKIHLHQLAATMKAATENMPEAERHLTEAGAIADALGDNAAKAGIAMQGRRIRGKQMAEADDAELLREIEALTKERDEEQDLYKSIRYSLAIAGRLTRPGSFEKAIDEYKKIITDSSENGFEELQANALINLMAAYIGLGDTDAAEELIHSIEQIMMSLDNTVLFCIFLCNQARLRIDQRRIVEAGLLINKAKDLESRVRHHQDVSEYIDRTFERIQNTSMQCSLSDLTLDELHSEYMKLRAWDLKEKGDQNDSYSPMDQLWYYWRRDDLISQFNTEAGSVGLIVSSESGAIQDVDERLGWMFDLVGYIADEMQPGGIEVLTIPTSLEFPYINILLASKPCILKK